MRCLSFILALILISQTAAAQDQYMGLYWNATTKEVMSGLDVADMDGDGIAEIAVSGSADGSVYLFDGTGRQIWRKDVFSYINTVKLADVEGDGRLDVIAGHADLSAFDKSGNRTLKWRTPHSMGVYEIVGADLLGDGSDKLVFTSYNKEKCGRDKPGSVYAVDGATKDQIFRYTTGPDVPEALLAADLTGDGRDDILVGLIDRTTSSGGVCAKKYNNPSAILAISSGGTLLWQFETDGGVAALAMGDIDGDGRDDIVAGTYPTLYAIDADGKKIWENSGDINTYSEAVAVCDLDGDGKGEVIAGSDEVVVFDPSGNKAWSGLTDSRVYSLSCGDVDDDGNLDVIVGSGSVYVFSGTGVQRYRSPSHTTYGFVMANDIDGRGYDEVIGGSVRTVFTYRILDYAKKVLADELFSQALSRPSVEREAAIGELEKAKSLYSDIGMTARVSDCLNAKGRLEDTSGAFGKLFDEGMAALNDSRDLMDRGDYLGSYRKAYEARSKFTRPEWEPQRDDAKDMMERVKDILEDDAARQMLLANESFYRKEYNVSYLYVMNATEIYNKLGDFENAEKADILAKKLRDIIGEGHTVNGTSSSGFGLGGLVSGINPVHVAIVLALAALVAVTGGIAYYSATMFKKKEKKAKKRRPSLAAGELHKKSYKKEKKERYVPKPTPTFEAKQKPQEEFVSRNGFMKRTTRVQPYLASDDELGLDQKLTQEPEEVRYEASEHPKMELPPNKGIFKASECREGVCLNAKKIIKEPGYKRVF